jgi:hypothetical protein
VKHVDKAAPVELTDIKVERIDVDVVEGSRLGIRPSRGGGSSMMPLDI